MGIMQNTQKQRNTHKHKQPGKTTIQTYHGIIYKLMATNQLTERDAVHKIQKNKQSATITLPKEPIKTKLNLDIEDLHGEYVPIEVDGDNRTITIELPD